MFCYINPNSPCSASGFGSTFCACLKVTPVGGVLLGMEQVGLNGRAGRERLIETTKVLLNSSGTATLISVG